MKKLYLLSIFFTTTLYGMPSRLILKPLSLRDLTLNTSVDNWCIKSREFTQAEYHEKFDEHFKTLIDDLKEQISPIIEQRAQAALQNYITSVDLDFLPKAILSKYINHDYSYLHGNRIPHPPLHNIIFQHQLPINHKMLLAKKLLALGANVNATSNDFMPAILLYYENPSKSQLLRLFCQQGLNLEKPTIKQVVRLKYQYAIKIFLDYVLKPSAILKAAMKTWDITSYIQDHRVFIEAIVKHPRSIITQKMIDSLKKSKEEYAPINNAQFDELYKTQLKQTEEVFIRRYDEQHAGILIVQNNERAIVSYASKSERK